MKMQDIAVSANQCPVAFYEFKLSKWPHLMMDNSFEGKSSTAYMVNTPSYDGRDIYQSIGSSQGRNVF